MNKIREYINYLDMMRILLQDEKDVSMIVKKDENLRKHYLSTESFETLKNIIIKNNQTSFIDLEIKKNIYNYLALMRKINLEQKLENYKEMLKNINECICMCNIFDNKTDSKIFYASQLYSRTGGYLNLDECYQRVQISEVRNEVKKSIIKDFNIFKKFLFEKLYEGDDPTLFINEYTLWSINKFVDDIPEILKYENFAINSEVLVLCMKKNRFNFFRNCGYDSAQRIASENKRLQKKLR